MIVHDGGQAFDLSAGIEISIPLDPDGRQPTVFGLPAATREVYREAGFVGAIREGGPCNVDVLRLVPHGNGTHTECMRHVADVDLWACDVVPSEPVQGILVTTGPGAIGADRLAAGTRSIGALEGIRALIVRTGIEPIRDHDAGPGGHFDVGAVNWMLANGIEHLVTDLPSIDPLDDGGIMAAHHAFFETHRLPEVSRRTVTEMVHVPEGVADGRYLLSIHAPLIRTDAVPSRLILYPLHDSIA